MIWNNILQLAWHFFPTERGAKTHRETALAGHQITTTAMLLDLKKANSVARGIKNYSAYEHPKPRRQYASGEWWWVDKSLSATRWKLDLHYLPQESPHILDAMWLPHHPTRHYWCISKRDMNYEPMNFRGTNIEIIGPKTVWYKKIRNGCWRVYVGSKQITEHSDERGAKTMAAKVYGSHLSLNQLPKEDTN